MDLGHWTTDLPHEPNAYGFIYVITNKIINKKYIGKKQMQTVLKRKPLKGKKRKRCEVIQTDWRTYTGSCTDLNNDIAMSGKSNFEFSITRFCQSKFEMAYFETKEQFDNEVLLSESYYNGIINCRIGRVPKNFKK